MNVEYRSNFHDLPTCWEERDEKLFRFWVGNEYRGFPHDKLIEACYFEPEKTLSLIWPGGTVVVIGPKALDVYNAVAEQKCTRLKADGKDILSVTFEPE